MGYLLDEPAAPGAAGGGIGAGASGGWRALHPQRHAGNANQPYVRTARAKGLREGPVVLRHAFRNALIPVVTMLGIQIGFLLSGVVLVEVVFTWPGLGRYAVDSVLSFDFTRSSAPRW